MKWTALAFNTFFQTQKYLCNTPAVSTTSSLSRKEYRKKSPAAMSKRHTKTDSKNSNRFYAAVAAAKGAEFPLLREHYYNDQPL